MCVFVDNCIYVHIYIYIYMCVCVFVYGFFHRLGCGFLSEVSSIGGPFWICFESEPHSMRSLTGSPGIWKLRYVSRVCLHWPEECSAFDSICVPKWFADDISVEAGMCFLVG